MHLEIYNASDQVTVVIMRMENTRSNTLAPKCKAIDKFRINDAFLIEIILTLNVKTMHLRVT